MTDGNGFYSVQVTGPTWLYFYIEPPVETRLAQRMVYEKGPFNSNTTMDFDLVAGHLFAGEVQGPTGDSVYLPWGGEVIALTDPPPGNDGFYFWTNWRNGTFQTVLPPDVYSIIVDETPRPYYPTRVTVDLRFADVENYDFILNVAPEPLPGTVPPNATLIALGTPDDEGYLSVTGAPGAVTPFAAVVIAHMTSGRWTNTVAAEDGSFSATAYGPPGSFLIVKQDPSHRYINYFLKYTVYYEEEFGPISSSSLDPLASTTLQIPVGDAVTRGRGDNVAPGYKLDFPNTAGVCADCHAPGAAVNALFTTDMNTLTEVNRDFGVHCDFCHKVAGVYLDPATGLPYPNVPGVMSMDVRRPFPDSPRYQLFFGTFDDDNVPLEDTKLPLIMKSQWCAACHQFSFWGTPIYQSFKEWLESPYPARGIECQTCHMPPDGVTTNVALGMGGVERDPMTIHAHTMPGAASVALLQNTVSMTISAQRVADIVQVTVTITNTQAGHHVPTDFPGRHMILVVTATDGQGQALPLQNGPVVPDWGGDKAGKPGKAFAKVLRDLNSGQEPTAAYWNPTIIVSDNRLPALGVDTSAYEFAAPPSGTVNVEARLIFRRVFGDLMDTKRWDKPDIVMEQETESVVIP